MNVVDGLIRQDTMTGMTYGELPTGLIMSKFEETDMGDDDYYEPYARTMLTDRRPDAPAFEHEEPRGAVNRNYGRLQLQYYGHRGDADDPYRPEYFDQFIGPEDQDPRGINTGPDFKQMVRQREARGRFTRFTPDACDQITGGGRSEFRAMQDKQTVQRRTRDTFKVFDRQLDGRRDGMRREYDHVSALAKQIQTQSYGDYIADKGLNVQRTTTIMCKDIVRNSRKWRATTADADFSAPKYSLLRKGGKREAGGAEHALEFQHTAGESSDSVKYKAAGLLMADLARKRRTTADSVAGDIDHGITKDGRAATKTAAQTADLAQILRDMRTDADFASTDLTLTGKTGVPQPLVSQLQKVVLNHSAPAHHYFNAEIIYRTVKPGADLRSLQGLVITDSAAPEIRDMVFSEGKSAKRRMISGAKLDTEEDAESAESDTTCSYKHLLRQAKSRVNKHREDGTAGESDDTQTRHVDHTTYRNPSANDVVSGGDYGENVYGERLAAPLGRKYLNRQIDRDTRRDEMSDLA